MYNPATAVTVTPGGLIVPSSGNLYDGIIRAGNGVPADQAARVPNAGSALVQSIPDGAPRGLYNVQNLLCRASVLRGGRSPAQNSRCAAVSGLP